MDIKSIQDPTFLKTMSISELVSFSETVRDFLIENLAQTGGHLSSNLGVVELTIAMHRVFDSPKDQLIFDVGHQGYVHKLLTGRAKDFDTLRKADGLSGFLKRAESEHDCFEAGHSSTSLAAGAGMLFAKEFNKSIGHVVMLIGDGALTSGMALEALNFMGHYPNKQPIIILNDNEMSISPNIGYLSKALTRLRMKRSVRTLRRGGKKMIPRPLRSVTAKVEKRIKGFISGHSVFEDLGYLYFGPIDGHNYKLLLTALKVAKSEGKPCIVHVKTKKGKGYPFSEQDQNGKWHGAKPFEIKTGNFIKGKPTIKISYSKLVANYLMKRAETHKDFYVITPAMVSGSELDDFQASYPTQLIDVGIAEQTAVTMASALALKGVLPFISIYSTFLQRAYDQVIHDVARHNVHVVFGIDRAGLVGGDGETHQGIYDIPLLAHIPNMTIAHPKDAEECYGILNYAMNEHTAPIAVRYEKINLEVPETLSLETPSIAPSWEQVTTGTKGTIITFGDMVNKLEARIKRNNLDYTLINARYIKPLDETMLTSIDLNQPIITVEESILQGGLGSMIRDYLSDNDLTPIRFKRLGFSDCFVEQGDRQTMLKRFGLDVDSVLDALKAMQS